MTKDQIFDNVISDLKSLRSLKKDSSIKTYDFFKESLKGLQETTAEIYDKRIANLKDSLKNHAHLIRLSTFELMEHDFRENSHSNVLQYIFDYNNLGKGSVDILQNLIRSENTDSSNYISENLSKRNYTIFREYSTGKGRIDLLISDKTNKFNIVIENKLLSGIATKEINEKKEITKTQLDDYYQFINSTFKNYTNLFFLLSYYVHDDEINNYDKINYETVYSSIKDIQSDDIILSEYKSLLTSLITGIDKQQITSSLQKIKNNSIVQLNSIEKLNKIISYEI